MRALNVFMFIIVFTIISLNGIFLYSETTPCNTDNIKSAAMLSNEIRNFTAILSNHQPLDKTLAKINTFEDSYTNLRNQCLSSNPFKKVYGLYLLDETNTLAIQVIVSLKSEISPLLNGKSKTEASFMLGDSGHLDNIYKFYPGKLLWNILIL